MKMRLENRITVQRRGGRDKRFLMTLRWERGEERRREEKEKRSDRDRGRERVV